MIGYWIYWGISWILHPLIWLGAWIRLYQKKEVCLLNRFGIPTRTRPPSSIIWVHAASIGESMAALPLIQLLLNQAPSLQVLLTTTTVGSYQVLKKRLPSRCFHQFIPFDSPQWVNRFLNFWNPKAFILIESEIWPNLIRMSQARGIPFFFLNGRLSKRAFNRWCLIPSLFQYLFQNTQICGIQSQEDLKDFQTLGIQSAEFMPSLKYFAPPLPIQQDFYQFLQNHIQNRPFWVAASTHPGEEELFLSVHQQLKNRFPDAVLLLAPRHPTRRNDVQKQINQFGFKSGCRSSHPDRIEDVFLLDTLGELGNLFALKGIVVIGGSFTTFGGHNPIEPGIMGNWVLWGPHMENSKGIIPTFEGISPVLSTKDDLFNFLNSFLGDQPTIHHQSTETQKRLLAYQKGLSDLAEKIKQFFVL